VDLYRAIDFPFRWKREATLLDGVVASDATLMRDRAGWWMFAATRLWRATGWDSLSVFYAPSLLGPWRACRHNPVVLDATAARPPPAPSYPVPACICGRCKTAKPITALQSDCGGSTELTAMASNRPTSPASEANNSAFIPSIQPPVLKWSMLSARRAAAGR